MNLKSMGDEELLKQTKAAVNSEKTATNLVIRHLQEVYNRRLYLPRYSSIFDMLRREYNYCEPSATLRMNAIRLMNDVPAVKEKIQTGELSLTAAANIQSFLFAEKKQDRPYSQNAKLELIDSCVGKSVRDVQKEFVRRNPEIEKRDVVRHTSEDRLRISYASSSALEKNLEQIKLIWSHVDPNMSREDLLIRMSEVVLEQIDPQRKATRAAARKGRSTEAPLPMAIPTPVTDELVSAQLHAHEVVNRHSPKRSRYVTAQTTHDVRAKNAERGCEFVEEKTGEVCGSKFQLQKDHIQPYLESGDSGVSNLRMYCAAHNRWAWRSRSKSNLRCERAAYG